RRPRRRALFRRHPHRAPPRRAPRRRHHRRRARLRQPRHRRGDVARLPGPEGAVSLRVLIPTMAWRRIPLLELWAAHHTTLDVPGVEVDVLVCGSEPDAEAVARRHGCHYVHAPNAPLGAKAQARLDATRELEWDYLLFLGSDDFIAAPTLAYYARRMAGSNGSPGHDLVAPMDLYYWAPPVDASTGGAPRRPARLWHSAGYTPRTAPHRVGEPMAVGRCLSREIVERLDFALWPP